MGGCGEWCPVCVRYALDGDFCGFRGLAAHYAPWASEFRGWVFPGVEFGLHVPCVYESEGVLEAGVAYDMGAVSKVDAFADAAIGVGCWVFEAFDAWEECSMLGLV